jgi:hypothetical protein
MVKVQICLVTGEYFCQSIGGQYKSGNLNICDFAFSQEPILKFTI